MGASTSCFEGFVAPKRPTGNMTLKYFPITGRAEPIRLALLLGKFQYYDHRLTGNEWLETEKAKTPFGQLPVLVVEGKQLAQTKAILRYIGKISPYKGSYLYPQDPLLAAKVDEIMDAFDDLWILLAPTYRIEDKEQQAAARQRLFAEGGEAAAMVQMFEKILQQSSSGYVVSEAGLTVADLMYFSFLNTIRSGFVDGLTPSLFNPSDHPRIMKHKELIASIPEIAAYYSDVGASNPTGNPHYEVFKSGK
eukprot:TRINITY_DN12319_c0_g3_i1.p1 TRINITY_DN12319_c0_g3~~TRINITY_DN12319_c0_g3_i1.p1  ORF type:complete len:250 (+),score=60.68 TRINITY_DN12319_c0_g3_i1:56-805(+)